MLEGGYIFNLIVKDNKGAADTASVTITVIAAVPQPPVADAGADQTITLPVNSASLDASQSYAPNGTISSYSWTEQSGPSAAAISNGATVSTTATGLIKGTYIFNVTIKDNKGQTATASVTVWVISANPVPLTADAGRDTIIAIPSTIAMLDGDASQGAITSYQWTELSGPTLATISSSNAALTPVGNLVAGEYVFQLTITDSKGSVSQASVKVSVISTLRYTGQIILYPNPAHDVVNLRLISDSSGTVRVSIYDMEGRIVLASEIEKSKSNLDSTFYISRLAGGTYVLQAIIGNSRPITAKFIKQ